MTVATNTDKVQDVGDGAVSQSLVPFPFFEDTDLEVYTQTSAGAAAELKTLGTHYTITGNGKKLTGEVDWSVTPPASGVAILIKRVIPQTQESDYVNNDIFNAEILEDDFDRAVMHDQQIQEEMDRAVKVGPFGSAQVFPDPLDGYFLFWRPGTLANGIPTSLSGVTTTPYTLTLLDDSSAGQARATLGFSPVDQLHISSEPGQRLLGLPLSIQSAKAPVLGPAPVPEPPKGIVGDRLAALQAGFQGGSPLEARLSAHAIRVTGSEIIKNNV